MSNVPIPSDNCYLCFQSVFGGPTLDTPATITNLNRNLGYLEMQKILGGQQSEQVPADCREQFSDLKLTSGGEL